MKRPTIAIIGLGLIGGSLLQALHQAGKWRLSGWDIDKETIDAAWRAGYLQQADMTPATAVQDADIVVLCVPIYKLLPLVKQIKPFLKPGVVVTDVSSVRGKLTSAIQAELADKAYFIGGHPMAGRERHSWQASSADLFAGKAYVLEQSSGLPHDTVTLIEEMVASIGAHAVWMTAAVHDRAAALISHAPHVVASAMVLTAANDEKGLEAKSMAAGCFRDMTRVAASGPDMWTDITCENRQEVVRALQEISQKILSVAASLEAGDKDTVRAFFTKAHQVKQTNFMDN